MPTHPLDAAHAELQAALERFITARSTYYADDPSSARFLGDWFVVFELSPINPDDDVTTYGSTGSKSIPYHRVSGLLEVAHELIADDDPG